MPKKYCLKDILKKIDRNKTTLIRWEDLGLIPKAKRDSRGWRYYTKKEIDGVVSLIKSTDNFKNIFSKKDKKNMPIQKKEIKLNNNIVPYKINLLRAEGNSIKKDFGYSDYFINSFNNVNNSFVRYFDNQKIRFNKLNNFKFKKFIQPRDIYLNDKIVTIFVSMILFFSCSLLLLDQPTRALLSESVDKPIQFLANSLAGIEDLSSYIVKDQNNIVDKPIQLLTNSLVGTRDTILYFNNNAFDFVFSEAGEYAGQFRRMTNDAGETINSLASLNMNSIPLFARSFENKMSKGIILFLDKTKNISLANLNSLIKKEVRVEVVVPLIEETQSINSTFALDELKNNILETETEITIYYKKTGQSYCIKVRDKKVVSLKGECFLGSTSESIVE